MWRSDGAAPHAFPFRLVDAVQAGRRGEVVEVTLSANAFYGRGQPCSVALLSEVLAQAVALTHSHSVTAQARLVALHGVRVLQEVFPGDRLRVEVRQEGSFGPLRRYFCRALRAGSTVAEGALSVAE